MKFNTFLNKLKTNENAALVEAIESGYKVLHESITTSIDGASHGRLPSLTDIEVTIDECVLIVSITNPKYIDNEYFDFDLTVGECESEVTESMKEEIKDHLQSNEHVQTALYQQVEETLNEGLKEARKNVGEEKCWEGYKADGTKKNDKGVEVPNCKKEKKKNVSYIEESEESEDFKPHMMYDPKTGKGYKANKIEDHLRMNKLGYGHEKGKK